MAGRRPALTGIVAGLALCLVPTIASAQAPAAFSAPPVEMTDPAPDGVRIDTDGVIGNWYAARGDKPAALILLLGGSEGALGAGTTRIARALHAEGFSVLHLSYYRAPGQPQALALIPLETFDRALAWITRQPHIDRHSLAVVGGSKGAEAALLIATRHPELRATVAGMPSNVVWPGINWKGIETRSTWSEHGKPLPALPYGAFSGGGLVDVYSNGLKALPQHPDTRIPIERAKAPIMLVCGEADALWPSCPMARDLSAHDPDVTLLAYRDAGHAVFGVPVAKDNPARAGLAQLGGTVDGNAGAREDAWPKVVAFLHKTLDVRRR